MSSQFVFIRLETKTFNIWNVYKCRSQPVLYWRLPYSTVIHFPGAACM